MTSIPERRTDWPNGKIFLKRCRAYRPRKAAFPYQFRPQVCIRSKSLNRIVADLTKPPRLPFNRLSSRGTHSRLNPLLMPGSFIVTSFGRVISVRGSLARVGLLAASQMPVSEIRATVGRFVSIRCANSIIVAMITEVSCENLPSSELYRQRVGRPARRNPRRPTRPNSSAASPTIRPSAMPST